ncbi:hypothetical protein [Rhodococcus zopfii]|uniref:hypothetical protein n=1 Tax=Rhodococcus zopfii TaxID=43772 RepID=UPI000932C628|nr:hypothetical protein [Rhodococcus zopfii]
MLETIAADVCTATQMLASGDFHRAEQYARTAYEAATESSFDPTSRADALEWMTRSEALLAEVRVLINIGAEQH